MNRSQARTEILSLLKGALDNAGLLSNRLVQKIDDEWWLVDQPMAALVDPIVEEDIQAIPVEWPNVSNTPDREALLGLSSASPWLRVSLDHLGRSQASLQGSTQVRRWEAFGLLSVQIFVPSGKGLLMADGLVKILEDALDGAKTAGGAWFRNNKATEVGNTGNWHQTNFTSEFVYDDVK